MYKLTCFDINVELIFMSEFPGSGFFFNFISGKRELGVCPRDQTVSKNKCVHNHLLLILLDREFSKIDL